MSKVEVKKTLTERMADVVLSCLGNRVEVFPMYDEDGNELLKWELFAEFNDEMYPVTCEDFVDEDAAWDAWRAGVEYIKSKVNNGKENGNV